MTLLASLGAEHIGNWTVELLCPSGSNLKGDGRYAKPDFAAFKRRVVASVRSILCVSATVSTAARGRINNSDMLIRITLMGAF